MSGPLVSIIIPVYNREKVITRTLESAVYQTYENCEIIIVDNYSTDQTFELLNQFASSNKKIRLFQNETNIGPVRNWDKCLGYARGEFVKILWSDDYIAYNFIENCLPFLFEKEDVGFVFTRTEIFDDQTNEKIEAYKIGETNIYDSNQFIKGILLRGRYPVSPGCALFRRGDLLNHLMVDIPNKHGVDFSAKGAGNDLLLFLLTAHKYAKFAFINETLSFFRSHRDSITCSATGLEVLNLYDLAKAYFVENYIDQTVVRRKFNSILFETCVTKKIINKCDYLKSVKDYYLNTQKSDIDIFYLLGLMVKRIIGYIKNVKIKLSVQQKG